MKQQILLLLAACIGIGAHASSVQPVVTSTPHLLLETLFGGPVGSTTNGPNGNGGYGNIIQYDAGSTAVSAHYDFTLPAGPNGSLTETPDGHLYGITTTGGANGGGFIFSYDYASNTVTTMADLPAGYSAGANFTLAPNGLLYAAIPVGGTNGGGVIISYNPGAHTFSTKASFPAGSYPTGLTLGTDGSFYGITSLGGTNGLGFIFKYVPGTNYFTTKFNLSNGGNTFGTFLLGNNGNLYCLVSYYGPGGGGYIGMYNPAGNTFTDLYDFPYSDAYPSGNLVKDANGLMYGVTNRGGGPGSPGLAFTFDPSTNTYQQIAVFNNVTGVNPSGSPFLASDGMLYLATEGGPAGGSNDGAIVRINPATHAMDMLVAFNGTNGAVSHNSAFIEYKAPMCTPTVTISANNTNLDTRTNVILTATPTNAGNRPTYNWYMNGTLVAGIHGSVLSYGGALGNGDEIHATVITTATIYCGADSSLAGQVNTSNTVTFTKSGSSVKDIMTLTMPNQVGTSVINNGAATVSAVVTTAPAGRTAIHPTRLYVSPNAAYGPSYAINRDFSVPVTYTVRAQDGSDRVWTVTVLDQSGNKTSSTVDALNIATDMNIYPNPATTYINVMAAGGTDVPVITVLDIEGRVMYHQALPVTNTVNHMIDLSDFAAGTYFVHLAVGSKIESRSFVIAKQ